MNKIARMQSKLGSMQIIPANGGCFTVREPGLLPFGAQSWTQNVRGWHPGYETRKGYTKFNEEAMTLQLFGHTYEGEIENDTGTWSTLVAASGGSDAATTLRVRVENDGGAYLARRCYISFDLNGIDEAITSASVKIQVSAKSGEASQDLSIEEAQWTYTASPVVGDFGQVQGTSFGTATITGTGFATFTFNASGLAYLNGLRETTGHARFCIRDYTYDFSDSAPADGIDNRITFYNGRGYAQSTVSGWSDAYYLELGFASGLSPKNAYQLRMTDSTEKHFLLQDGAGILRDANAEPPDVTSQTFGPPIWTPPDPGVVQPASFSTLRNQMGYSDGWSKHLIYTGDASPVSSFLVWNEGSTPGHFPQEVKDYTKQVGDDDPDTVAVLDSLAATNGAIFIRTESRAESFSLEFNKSNGSGAAGAITWYEWTGTAWSAVDFTDNTAYLGVPFVNDGTLARDVTIYATSEKSRMINNKTGYWYKLVTSGTFDSEVEISKVTYKSLPHPIENVWNGVPEFVIEAQHDDNSAGIKKRYAASTVSIPSMTSADALYFSTIDPAEAIYIDVGDTPCTTTVTLTISYWNGTGWTAYGSIEDGTSGFNETGWIYIGRQSAQFQTQFNNSQYTAYWYKITVNATTSSATEFSMKYQPYFDVDDFGKKGRVNCAWKDRMLWSFDNNEVIVSQKARPMVLNGTDYAVLNPGDGRSNKVVAMVNFYNEVVMFQEEEGTEGGCITLYEGYNPSTFGKLILSSRYGTFSPKSVCTVDGSLVNLTDTRSTAMTQIYFLSHYGVGMTDGQTATIISQGIQNYFDARFSECIRRGYEKEMWIAFDSNNQCVRMGLVSGSTATKCNVFPVLDLIDGSWYFDSYANSMSFLMELEGSSGQNQTLQYSGGSTTGYVYRQNDGTNDDGTAIDAYMTFEFHNGGWLLDISEAIPSFKAVAGASVTITSKENGQTKKSETQSFAANRTGDVMRRVRHLLDTKQTESISITIQCNTKDVVMYLYYMGLIGVSEEYK